jgi:hypothetical protein
MVRWRKRGSREAKVAPHLKAMTTLEKRRTIFVLAPSLVTFGIDAFEITAHVLLTPLIFRQTLEVAAEYSTKLWPSKKVH